MNFTRMMSLVAKELNKNAEAKVDMALTSKMASQIDLWSRMFENRAPWVNGNTKSCNLPAAIASELARLVTLELKSEITGSARADYMQDHYADLLMNLRRYVEYGCAKGGLVFKPYVTAQGIDVQFIQADAFFPVTFDGSGNITCCVFAEQLRKGQSIFTRLEIHEVIGDKLKITNRAYRSSNDFTLGSEVAIQSVAEWSQLQYEVVFSGVHKIPIGYFKVPLANTSDTDSPLGASVYSRAVDLVKEADIRYSQISWEYEAKEAAIHIGESMLKNDPNNADVKMAPAHRDRLYRAVEYDTGATNKPLLDSYSPDIRSNPLFEGFNAQLRLIEFNCSLAYGTLSDLQEVDKTAEEIKTSKQRSYAMVSDTQIALQNALRDMIDAMDFYCSVYDLCPAGRYDISFNWDDSVIVDADKARESDRFDVAMGAMSLAEYRAKWYGETEEEAAARLPQQAEVMP